MDEQSSLCIITVVDGLRRCQVFTREEMFVQPCYTASCSRKVVECKSKSYAGTREVSCVLETLFESNENERCRVGPSM